MMLFPYLSKQHQTYTLPDEPKVEHQSPRKYRQISTGWTVTLLVVAACVVGMTSFAAGRYSVHKKFANELSLVPYPFSAEPSHKIALEFNKTFTESSAQADRAWKDVMPPEGGFFDYPSPGEGRATFSVYHQMHCLNGIRKSYWTFVEAALSGRVLRKDEIGHMAAPAHVQHCIDFLRQSLMCKADTTIEIRDEAIMGVKGFGVRHECVDWDRLIAWTARRQL
ncbi:hypothetical protein JMJ35_006615 [Cladonia borealis]|uniref:Tat pathway signal sequence n=1 Tax=Cladonia borealis TaxID=184061 RepID=A0AA39V0F9_9LECA|nr:hypothetical protein JMJ35_006615 [Cladonia borealis]